MNPRVDAFLRTEKQWREEMAELRKIALACGLTEEVKWGKPCYAWKGSNVALISPFKESCALAFTKGVLLKDPKRLLRRPGENTQSGRWIKFTSVAEVAKLAPTLKAYLKEAIAAEKAGLKVAYKKTSDYKRPDELTRKLKGDPELKAAFEALTPGRQRGYLLYFGSAKQSQTRAARIDKCRPQILRGRGWNER